MQEMSWLNFNDSLSSIKGQLTSLASDVLANAAEGIVHAGRTGGEEITIENCRTLVTDSHSAVATTQQQHTRVEELHVNKDPFEQQDDNSNNKSWFWKPFDNEENSTATALKTVALEAQVKRLQAENRELVEGLERLDQDCQQTTDKLVAMKDELRVELEELRGEYATLQEKYAAACLVQENKLLALKTNVENVNCTHVAALSKWLVSKCDLETNNGSSFEELLEQLSGEVLHARCLEKQLLEANCEKNKIVGEKNYEIEKLLHNSEILSQEVIEKSRTISEFEEECNELMKNNEALIEELQNYKASSSSGGLHTISEGNEDNLLDLETQLDSANRKIHDLQVTVAELEDSSKQESDSLELQTELDYIKRQLNLTGQELSHKKFEYDELLTKYSSVQDELSQVKNALEKTRGDFENLEYKYSELTINADAFSEENRTLKINAAKLDALLSEMGEDLAVQNGRCEVIQTQLERCIENECEKNTEIENLREKLQATKISETALKLQVDTLSKELTEAKQQVQAHQDSAERGDELKKSSEELATRLQVTECQLQETYAFLVSKNEENVQYYNEIQRLNLTLTESTTRSGEEIARLKKCETFLKEMVDTVSQRLLDEQSTTKKVLAEKQTIADHEQSLSKELERLRIHLVDIEDTYTRDLLTSEEKIRELQQKLIELEKREKDSSYLYTSVNVRANQQVETLQTQLQLVTVQRDELRREIDHYEDTHNKQAAALTNLQLVLDQFQRDKQNDIALETERIRRQIAIEHTTQDELRAEIVALRGQLEESKQGLQAASRLSDQLERSKQQLATLKEQEKKLRDTLSAKEAVCKELEGQNDTKVDKSLIKSLVVGMLSSRTSADRHQILKIIATVLDFNQRECEKAKLHHATSEATATVGGGSTTTFRDNIAVATGAAESLSQAFVKFLEDESKPKVVPNLLETSRVDKKNGNGTTIPCSRKSSSVLGEIVLPTFNDFGPNRNSGSILKDVLKDNS